MREASSLAVLFIDLDNFKNVNNTLGHTLGDILLQQVARQLASHVRGIDMLARVGGDEFILLMEAAERGGAETVAQAWQLPLLRSGDDRVCGRTHAAGQHAQEGAGRRRTVAGLSAATRRLAAMQKPGIAGLLHCCTGGLIPSWQ
jgi:GGDEF domain-containing protein